MAVTIIGMGRSGSSLTARLLNISGLYLGPADEMVGANSANEKGYWEHLRIHSINVRLLETFGGTWENPPVFPAGWTTSDAVRPLKVEVQELLETMRGQPLWGWKEPRTTLTLPFWRALVPNLRIVVCLRNPLDVYSSLRRVPDEWHFRGTFEGAMALWRCYTELALRQTRPHERVIVSYEDYFRDYRKTLAPVWELLGLNPVATGTPEDRALSEFIAPGLQHSQHTLHDVLAHPYIPRTIKQLYERLLEDRTELEAELSAASYSDTDAGSYDSGMVALLHTIANEKDASVHDEGLIVDPLEARESHIRQLEEQLAEVRCTYEADLEELQRHNATLQIGLEQVQQHNATLQIGLEQVQQHNATLQIGLEQVQQHNATLQTALSQTEWQIEWMTSSRGIRLVLKARAVRATLQRKGLLALTKRLVVVLARKVNHSGDV